MSLLSVTPSTGNRTSRRGRKPALRAPGVPRLRLVQEQHRSVGYGTCRATGGPGASAMRASTGVSITRASIGVSTRGTSTRGIAAGPARPRVAAGQPVRRPANSGIRLTRRGRIVVRIATAGFVVLAVVAGVLALDRTALAGSQAQLVPVAYRVVLPGETLWQIAGDVAPGVDRRDTVAQILELNALPNAAVSAGQRIAVPETSSRR